MNSNQTLLLSAVYRGQLEKAGELLDKDDVKAGEGMCLLHKACEKGFVEMVDLLLEKKADIDETDPEGITPLIAAARAGKSDIVLHLLSKGANQRAKTKTKLDAFAWAEQMGHKKVMSLLVGSHRNVPPSFPLSRRSSFKRCFIFLFVRSALV